MKNIIGFLLLFSIGYFGFGFYQEYKKFSDTPLNTNQESLTIQIPKGMAAGNLPKLFKENNLPINNLQFKIWSKLNKAGTKLIAGEFEINPTKMSALKALKHILSGKTILYTVTIPEGYNIWDIEKTLASSKLNFDKKKYWELIYSPKKQTKLPIPNRISGMPKRSLEGFLFPSTYSFSKHTTTEQFINLMTAQYNKTIEKLLQNHPWGKTPQGRYRLITLASIVEKESGNKREQGIIASVFWNRLKIKQRLQSDPTTIYGLLPNFDGNIRRVHLRQKTPYNTYAIPELPYGPICNPGLNAIKMVLNPPESPYFYFVADGNGAHLFSKTYAQHKINVDIYQRKTRPKPKNR